MNAKSALAGGLMSAALLLACTSARATRPPEPLAVAFSCSIPARTALAAASGVVPGFG